MTDIDAYIAARGRALGCQANGWRREWYRESMIGELTEMTLARRAFNCACESLDRVDRLPEVEEVVSCALAFHQIFGGVPPEQRASFDEMLDIAAGETGETISALAEALDLAARIWSEENERNI